MNLIKINPSKIKSQQGVTTIEYAMLAAGIAVVIGAVVSGDSGSFTSLLDGLFENISKSINSGTGGSGGAGGAGA